MTERLPARPGGARLPYGLREILVVLVGLVAAAALALAARAPSQDPETIGRVALARASAAASGAALAHWNMLRLGPELLDGQPGLWWSLEDTAAPAVPRTIAPASTPLLRACDALIGEARRLAGKDPTEAFSLLDEARSKAGGSDRATLILLEELRVAAAAREAERARASWAALKENSDGLLVSDGVALELLGFLTVASLLPFPELEREQRRMAERWSAGRLALPPPPPPGEPGAAFSSLRATLLEALLTGADATLKQELLPALQRREALARAHALMRTADVPEQARSAEGLTVVKALPPTADSQDVLLVFARRRDDAHLEGALIGTSRLESMLTAAVREQDLLPDGFGLRLDANGDEGLELDIPGGYTRLPGTPLALGISHEDPEGFVSRASARAAGTQRALFALAFVVALSSLATAHMLSRSRALVRARTAFVASVSHELRTPLSTILLMAENLESGRVTDEERRARYHSQIRREASRLRRLVEDVLDLARAERGEAPPLSPTWVELAPFAEELQATLAGRAEARGGTIRFECGHLAGTARLDPDAFTRAAANLVENAVVHGRSEVTDDEPARVDVELTCAQSSELKLSVRDHGPGVPPLARKRIFEPFARLGASKRNSPGAGLGLAIVKEIARAHGGRVTLGATPPGGGAVFELVVPLRPPGADEAESPHPHPTTA